jgi:hypothetical protein
MERRAFLIGGAVAAAGMVAEPALSQSPPAAGQPLAPSDIEAAVARLRKQFLAEFDPAYVENVIVPHFLVSTYAGERLWLPMINVEFTKENALPYDLWGLLSETWKPAPEEGVTVFLQGLEKRGPHNRRKRIYMTALTPDLYRPMYGDKVIAFFDKLLSDANAGKPLMRPYLENYFDLYWDLHLGVKGDAIPKQVHEIGQAFNTVLAYRDPTQKIVYDNYMTVRANLAFLKAWIDDRLADIENGKTPNPRRPSPGTGSRMPATGNISPTRTWCSRCSTISWRSANGATASTTSCSSSPPTPATPKRAPGSRRPWKAIPTTRPARPSRRSSASSWSCSAPSRRTAEAYRRWRRCAYRPISVMAHTSTSMDPVHWKDPEKFNPNRYKNAPTSHDINEEKCEQIGFAKCPFSSQPFDVADGRKAAINNSGFGTVYGVVDGKPLPVCDYAGFAPFGFGYRRCPGEQLTIQVFEDFLREVWKSGIQFHKLDIASPEPLPIGPTTVIGDNVGFTRQT